MLFVSKGFCLSAQSELVAGFLSACLLVCGCTTPQALELDADNTPIRVTTQGVLFWDESVAPTEVAEILDSYDVPHERAICILLDPDVKDLCPARYLMACMARAGYSSTVLVTQRHGEALNLGKKKKTSVGTAPKRETKRVIRYKKANE